MSINCSHYQKTQFSLTPASQRGNGNINILINNFFFSTSLFELHWHDICFYSTITAFWLKSMWLFTAGESRLAEFDWCVFLAGLIYIPSSFSPISLVLLLIITFVVFWLKCTKHLSAVRELGGRFLVEHHEDRHMVADNLTLRDLFWLLCKRNLVVGES